LIDNRMRHDIVEIWGWMCTNCKTAQASELHHCIIHARKGKYTKDKNLDKIYNLTPVCHACNVSRILDNDHMHREYWRRHCEMFGRDVMLEWLAQVNLRYVEKYSFE
jgi:hypothetical protein